MLKSIILFLLSLILYAISDYGVNMLFIYISFAIFLLGSWDTIKDNVKTKNYVSFNIIFLASFFCVTYLFPIVILDTILDVRSNQGKFIDYNYITRAVTLSTVAISAYFLGYKVKKWKKESYKTNTFVINSKMIRIAQTVNITLSVLVLLTTILFMRNNDSGNMTESPFLVQFYEVSLVFTLICNSYKRSHNRFKSFLNDNFRVLTMAFLVSAAILFTGSRHAPIEIILGSLVVYSVFYTKPRLKNLIILGFLGILLMFALRVTRTGDNSLKNGGVGAVAMATQESLEGQSVVVLLSDLYQISQELCLGYEYKTKNGLSYPEQIFTIPFIPIPKMPTILDKLLFNKTPFDMSTGQILNKYMSRYFDSTFGTHCVIDIYMIWGFLGVVIFFYLFGWMVAWLEKRCTHTVFCSIMYVMVVANALFIPRDSILLTVRPMLYAIILVYLYNRVNVSSCKSMAV